MSTTQPRLTIVVEGKSDADLLRALLGKELTKETRFFVGRGKMSLTSLGRSILFYEGGPVLVVKDADTTNQRLVDEQRGMTKLALSRAGSEEDFDVFVFVPELEVVYFEAPKALGHLLGHDVSPETLREGLLIPKAKLSSLVGSGSSSRGNGKQKVLDERIFEHLRTGKQAGEFIQSAHRLMLQHAES